MTCPCSPVAKALGGHVAGLQASAQARPPTKKELFQIICTQ